MKRAGFLIEQIADMENLRLAFYKAQKGKADKRQVQAFRANLENNLLNLRKQLLVGNVRVGDYHLFKIYDPKERIVCAAEFSERVLHHALMNVCAPYFERQFIYSTCANREGKGAYFALDIAHKAMMHYRFVAKLDVRKYFDSIHHEVLILQLRRIFKDATLLSVFEQIVRSYAVTDNRGLPIGNLTSQYFANFFLSGLDHFAKEKLLVAEYVRYMDDILLFGDDKELLRLQVHHILLYANNRLLLEMKPPLLQLTSYKTAFLGYSLRGAKIGLTNRSKRRFVAKYQVARKMLNGGAWDEKQFQEHILPLFAFVRHAYSKQYRNRIIRMVEGVEGASTRPGLTA